MVNQAKEVFDLVVIGGGPGGSTVATLVSMQGHRVLLLERERFPRYQIGESLLPSTVHGIGRILGVSEEIEKAGFVPKRGGTFRWGSRPEPWTFDFSTGIPEIDQAGRPVAYQVERAKFDNILLSNAKKRGVTVVEQALVNDLTEEGGRVTGVRYTDAEGIERQVSARFVVDASGNQSRFGGRVGTRVYSKFFQNVALFGYFKGGKRLPPPNSGNILCAAFGQGWFWYIPLSAELTSVGVVISRDYAHLLKDEHEAVFNGFIAECPLIQEYLANATRVTEGMYGQLRIRKDYSYCNTAFWKPGLALVGDAACFIDPVFSSGVHLATYSALLCARSINTVLKGTLDEARCFAEFERRYRSDFSVYYDFLIAFYDMHRDEDSYFWTARRILNTEERSNAAFVRLVAGGGTAPGEFFGLRSKLGDAFQAHVDNKAEGNSYKDAATFERVSAASGAFPLKKSIEAFEETHRTIIDQAFDAPSRASAGPVGVGLAVSADGLFWEEAPSPMPRQQRETTSALPG